MGVAYNGSAAKTVTAATMVGTLSEGTSNVTDGTMFLSSYASNNGFADTNAPNVLCKRKFSCVYNYIKGKLDSVYAAKSHTHSYAGSSSAGGAATSVVCSAATSNNDRPIVGTNTSNGLYYTTKATVNWSTGRIVCSALTLNIATGTAPITCTSTTKVTNLNADFWDGYHLSIVTALPSSPGSTTIYFIT